MLYSFNCLKIIEIIQNAFYISDQTQDIVAILRRLGLDKFIKLFQDNYIDYDAFLGLTDNDLASLDLPIGVRSKIRQEISRIKTTEASGEIIFKHFKKSK